MKHIHHNSAEIKNITMQATVNINEEHLETGILHAKKIEDVVFEVLTAVLTNVTILWDIALCSLYVNRCSEGTYHLHLQDEVSKKPVCSGWLGNMVVSYSVVCWPLRWR
jgi:hypothetical protein